MMICAICDYHGETKICVECDDITRFAKRLDTLRESITLPAGLTLLTTFDRRWYLQICCETGTCNITGKSLPWKSRKWMLSFHMTDGEIVQTAFRATLDAIEHEIREGFKYKERAIFDPHYDIEKLWDLRGESDCLKERD